MLSLAQRLEQLGANLDGWQLLTAEAITADGRTIVGNGLDPDGDYEGYVVRLDDAPPLPAVPVTSPTGLLGLVLGLTSALSWAMRRRDRPAPDRRI
jgi:hypothetical protein